MRFEWKVGKNFSMKTIKSFAIIFTTVLFLTTTTSISAQEFDKSVYYSHLSTKDIDVLNKELNTVKRLPLPQRNAYEGALLAKKAGLASGPMEKLNLFKSGKKKLENAIKTDNQNPEFRFLRLIIQENSPKIVEYKGEIKEDSEFVKKNFNSLPDSLKKVISDYSKNSKVLKPDDF